MLNIKFDNDRCNRTGHRRYVCDSAGLAARTIVLKRAQLRDRRPRHRPKGSRAARMSSRTGPKGIR